MLRRLLTCVLLASVFALTGCKSAPVYDVTAAPVTSTKPMSMQAVEQAIIGAGTSLGWQMAPQGAGKITGTLILRTHRAVVDITYDTKSYSIKYKDSDNLNYDGRSIHSNYNGWIQNLDRAIRARLA
jgi:hypothetical protein